MISQQVRTWEVFDTRTLEAMQTVPREPFVPAAWRSLAYADCALPLAGGKHMLTPMLAGRMLQSLGLRQGEQVLEIGTGSGYLSACLAALGGARAITRAACRDRRRGARQSARSGRRTASRSPPPMAPH